MTQVETWFSILHRKAIQRGVFRSVRALITTIQQFLADWDETKHPFFWVRTPNEVLPRTNVKVTSRAIH